MPRLQALAAVVRMAVVLAALCAHSAAPLAGAQEPAGPARCRVGAYVMSLHDLDPAAGTFQADLWLWSVCPAGGRAPLETMEFVNAEGPVVTGPGETLDRGGAAWSTLKASGTFRHDWDVRDFPFDRHALAIVLEEGIEDAAAFVYEADAGNTTYDPAMEIGGWRITGFEVAGGRTAYRTSFGDPALPEGGGSEYARLTLGLGIERTELGGFFKLTAVVYASFVLSLITYFMHVESPSALSPRVGILAAALFATAVNMATASEAVGSGRGLTLVDKVHVVVLAYILAAMAAAMASRLLEERGRTEPAIVRLNHLAAAAAAASFVAVNAALIAAAANAG